MVRCLPLSMFGGLVRGWSASSSSCSSSPLLQPFAAAAVVQGHCFLQVAQTIQQQQLHCQAFSSSAAAAAHQQHATLWHARVSPLQQLSHVQHVQPSLWQQQRQQPSQQQSLLQQVRTFVLMPRRVKYRKAHKSMGFNETICGNTRQLAFGLYGIRALEHCRIPANTLEAVRRTLRRTIKKSTMLWIRVTPNVPVTSKPAEVRMGKGKGTLDYWAAPIRAGQIIFEMDRCSKATAMQAVQSIKAKMPIKIDFVEWN